METIYPTTTFHSDAPAGPLPINSNYRKVEIKKTATRE